MASDLSLLGYVLCLPGCLLPPPPQLAIVAILKHISAAGATKAGVPVCECLGIPADISLHAAALFSAFSSCFNGDGVQWVSL